MNIAIVIPAFKPNFLKSTLESLSNQSDKQFAIYIGDDASPHNLEKIVREYSDKLNIEYVRFQENLGGVDLVAHWNRCLGLMNGEEWFVLFSDDDLMDAKCIEKLKENILENPECDVFHFDIRFINEKNGIISIPPPYLKRLSVLDFFDKLYSGKIEARMPEFTFRRKHFEDMGGFVPFELAMRSDNATVIQCAFEHGITTVPDSLVSWRVSELNVSNAVVSEVKYKSFFGSLVDFFNWFDSFCIKKNIESPWSTIRKFDYLFNYGFNLRKTIGLDAFFSVLKRYKKAENGNLYILFARLFFFKIKKKI